MKWIGQRRLRGIVRLILVGDLRLLIAVVVGELGLLLDQGEPRDPVFRSQIDDVLQDEFDPQGQVFLRLNLPDAFQVLVHEIFSLALIEFLAHGLHDLRQTLEILAPFGDVIVRTALEQRLQALVQDGFGHEIELAQFANELDVADGFLARLNARLDWIHLVDVGTRR